MCKIGSRGQYWGSQGGVLGVGGLKNPWETRGIDLYDFWVISKIEFFPCFCKVLRIASNSLKL